MQNMEYALGYTRTPLALSPVLRTLPASAHTHKQPQCMDSLRPDDLHALLPVRVHIEQQRGLQQRARGLGAQRLAAERLARLAGKRFVRAQVVVEVL